MGLKQFTRDEIKNSADNVTRIIIHDKVYDVTEFLNEHPGGEEVLLDHAGRDASEDFDDVGHSLDAFTIMEKYVIGEVVESEKKNTKPRKGWIAGGNENSQAEKSSSGSGAPIFLIAGGIIALLLAILYFQ